MSSLRPELSIKNKYWLHKHRHYELKHFCLQYPFWKKAILDTSNLGSASVVRTPSGNRKVDPVGNSVIKRLYYQDMINLIERVAEATDEGISDYLLTAVTEGRSYAYLKSSLNIPCGKDLYYDRYRKFFWLLSKEKDQLGGKYNEK